MRVCTGRGQARSLNSSPNLPRSPGTAALGLAQQQARWGPDRVLHWGPALGSDTS